MNSKLYHIINQSEVISLASLLKLIKELDNDPSLISGGPLKIHILRNFTLELIEPYLKYYFYQSELMSQISFGGYDTILQDLMADDFSQRGDDIVVIAMHIKQFEPDYEISDWPLDSLSERLFEIFNRVASHTSSIVILNTFPRPFYSEAGIGSEMNQHSLSSKINQLNERIRAYAADRASRFFVVDWERLLMRLGEAASLDRRMDYMNRSPFRTDFLKLYAEEIAKVGRSLKGKSKKCLILDCDNTLWGGIIGEDGRQGIKLDRNEYPGRAYYDFQKTVLQLFHRGVLITLCSKNNENDVWDVLDNHPHCLIRREHLAAFRINWEDKVKNIADLAEELNIGIDSFVFVDDSDVECHLVSQALPKVTVRQVPTKLYEYPPLLFREGLFDALTTSQEDRKRTEMYQAESKRHQSSLHFNNIDDYLASLEIRAIIHPVKEHEIPRVAQLTQKTNQFNLTTRCYSESQISQFVDDENTGLFSLSVHDKFGDSGLTGVLIACREKSNIRIDTLLLSCRILGRKLEFQFIGHCLQRLTQEWNPIQWEAEYIPTPKNHQVSDLWEKFGFSSKILSDGAKQYQVASDQLVMEQVPFISVVTE